MLETITTFINKCETCKKCKYDRQPPKLEDHLTPTPQRPFEIINLDILTLDSKFYSTKFDQFSKYGQIYFIRNKTCNNIINTVSNFIRERLQLQTIICNSGREFDNLAFKTFCHNY